MSAGVLAFGAYLPQRRLQRKVIAAAHSWFEPSLAGLGRGGQTGVVGESQIAAEPDDYGRFHRVFLS